MLTIQIILLIFFLFAWSRAVQRYRAREIKLTGLIRWSFFWFVAGTVVLVPDATNLLAKVVGIGRGADLVIYVSLAFIFYVLFRVLTRLEKIEQHLTRITRDIALRDEERSDR